MPLIPVPNCRSQVERAVVAHLIDQGLGSNGDVLRAHDVATKPLLNLTVKAADSRSDSQPVSFIEAFDVQIIAAQSAANAKGETNREGKRVALDNLIGLAIAAMTPESPDALDLSSVCAAITTAGRALADSDDVQVAANNADMSQFTVLAMYFRGTSFQEPDAQNAVWREVRHFEIHACPKALS